MTLPEGYETQPEVGDPRGKDAESTEQTFALFVYYRSCRVGMILLIEIDDILKVSLRV